MFIMYTFPEGLRQHTEMYAKTVALKEKQNNKIGIFNQEGLHVRKFGRINCSLLRVLIALLKPRL